MSPPRFYLPQLTQSPTCILDGAEARHATSVLRLKAGQTICLFDGLGHQAYATIVSASKSHLELEIQSLESPANELSRELRLVIALPKGDRQRTLVDAATELGVTHFIPLVTERGVAQPTDNALERLRRAVIEASKQCGRNYLMQVLAPVSVNECAQWLNPNSASTTANSHLSVVAHPYNEGTPPVALSQLLTTVRKDTTIVIGPEGGLESSEVQSLLQTGYQPATLGPRILRIEIAGLAAVAQIAAWLQDDSTALPYQPNAF